jgi:hypothetical protein
MTCSVTISAPDVASFRDVFAIVRGSVAAETIAIYTPKQAIPTPAAEPIYDASPSEVDPVSATPAVEEPKRRGRPRKDQAPTSTEPVSQPEAAETKADEVTSTVAEKPADPAPVQEPAKVVTLDDVRAALQRVNETKGLETAKALLAKVGAKRISEVAEEKYTEFKALCDAA